MSSRNKYPKTATRRRFAEEWVKAHPRYIWKSKDMIQRIGDTLTRSDKKVVPMWNPPKHFADLIKLFVDIKYLVRHTVGVKGSPWKWACEYRVMSDIREFPYEPRNKIRSVAKGKKES